MSEGSGVRLHKFHCILVLRVPDEGYSGSVSCTLNLISTFLLLSLCLQERFYTSIKLPKNVFNSCNYI
jgi:hypothetical protein